MCKVHRFTTDLGPYAGETAETGRMLFDYTPSREGQIWETPVADVWGAVLRILYNEDVVGEGRVCVCNCHAMRPSLNLLPSV